MLGDFGVDQRLAVGLEGSQGARLILAHEARVADHVGSKNGGETALHKLLPPAR